jgi:enoyl-CoA hydratase/carnithine racemase
MKYDLPDELTVDADGAVRTILINRAAELNCVNENLHWAQANVWRQLVADTEAKVGPLQHGFSAEVATMQSDEHRQRLLDLQRKSKRS